MASRFLFNEELWEELGRRILEAKMVRAAVAYLGTGGTELLRLRRGDKLIVDMSLPSVRRGTTDPREVRKLLDEGVVVYTRQSLHAKFFIIDRVVIAGSSNISNNAKSRLDEAALLTDDVAAVRAAISAFEWMLTEPVREKYLERCMAEYRPPDVQNGGKRKSAEWRKLWVLGGLEYDEVPDEEKPAADRAVRKVSKKLQESSYYENVEVDYYHATRKRKLFEQIGEQDIIITCVANGRGYDVHPPGRILGVETIRRPNGKVRYLVLFEAPTEGEAVSWTEFSRAAPIWLPKAADVDGRPLVIEDPDDIDAVLRLWNLNGRFRERRR